MRALLVFLFVVVIAAPALAGDCSDKPLCYETKDFAFRVLIEKQFKAIDADMARVRDRADPWFGSVIDYMLEHPEERLYRAALVPLPDAHGVTITWNAGLDLESGETVWATQWLVPSDHLSPVGRSAPNAVFLSTGLLKPIPDGKECYNLILCFPGRTATGKTWSKKDVVGLAIENPSGPRVSAQ